MKKVDFLNRVCAELARMGIEDAEIRIQCQNTDRYLTSMGVGEESSALDNENPAAFAKLICGNIAKRQGAVRPAAPVTQGEPAIKPVPEPQVADEFTDEMPNVDVVESDTPVAPTTQTVCDSTPVPTEQQWVPQSVPPVNEEHRSMAVDDGEDDIKIFNGSHSNSEPLSEEGFEQTAFDALTWETDPVSEMEENDFQIDLDSGYDENVYAPADTYQGDLGADQYGYDTGYAEFEPEEPDDYVGTDGEYGYTPENSNGTIEFDVTAIKKRSTPPPTGQLEEEEDYFEKNDDDDYVPSGNPVLFWVLVVLTAFLWVPLALVLAVAIGLAFVFMLIFEAIYIPGIVAAIIGGSALSFAELIYSIIKFAGKNPSVAIFELGLGLLVAALTVGLPTVMYYLGVSIFPKCIKNYGKNVKKLFRKLRRLYRKLKGACSI